jgi:ATP-binding cassette, subfamily B, bacterial MsbA
LVRQRLMTAGAFVGATVHAGCSGSAIGSILAVSYIVLAEQMPLHAWLNKELVGSDSGVKQWLGEAILPVVPSGMYGGFLFALVVLLLLSMIGAIAMYVQILCVSKAIFRFERRMQAGMYRSMLASSVPDVMNLGAAEFVNRSTTDLREVTNAFQVLLSKGARRTIYGVGALAIAFCVNVQLTGAVLLVVPMVLYLFSWMNKQIRKRFGRVQAERGRIISYITETVVHLPVIKQETAEGVSRQRMAGRTRSFERENKGLARVAAIASPASGFLASLAFSLAAAVAGYIVFVLDVAAVEVLAVLALLGVAGRSADVFSNMLQQLSLANTAALRCEEILHMPAEQQIDEAHKRVKSLLGDHRESICFRDVSFTYPGQTVKALDAINLDVKFGQTVAIAGPNGCGKSTLLKVLTGIRVQDEGVVEIDGTDIRTTSLRSLREQISVVPQASAIFNETVTKNIAMGKPWASQQAIEQAARKALAHDFIEQLPDDYRTQLGDEGLGLSGGQQQRICMARALLAEPLILVLDEATSQVDTETERAFTKFIQEQRGEHTTFVITHRQSSVVQADMIVVMDQGQIIATGKHDDLMANCELYRMLVQSQGHVETTK